MQPKVFSKQILMPDGRTIHLETGKMARQAHGAVVLRLGKLVMLATVVSSKDAKAGVDFLPLSVDYQEKFASAGRIPGGFLRREGRLSDYEILISRLVDRALRPIFPSDYHADVQVNIFLLSSDSQVAPDAVAGLAAAAAIAVSDIPFNGPISEVRVAKIDGQLHINPISSELKRATIDMIVAANATDILMVEGEMNEVSEEEMLEAISFAHQAIQTQCQAISEFANEVGATQKREYSHETNDTDLYADIAFKLYDKAYQVATLGNPNKNERKTAFGQIIKDYVEALETQPDDARLALIKHYYHQVEKDAVRNAVMDQKIRLDGRATDQIRNIWSEVDLLPSAHGSALFTRGETQSLTTVTIGTKLDEQIIDGAYISGSNRFLLHYNFPGFSTGEVKPNRGPGRREVGHGNLAYRALKKIMPSEENNPYTIRIVSDILESNGSSSMATVCAATLALMDAGIGISSPVSGIAMGLITDVKTGRYAILSDILGDEDHLGDMDFKVTGTAKGITACQMDLKVEGLPFEVMRQALLQAKQGRSHILNEMLGTLSAVRPDLKPHAPRSFMIKILKEQIGSVIGPGGKIIQEIQRVSGATVLIEEVAEQGVVSIFATNQQAMDVAVNMVKNIVAIPEVDKVYQGVVRSIQPFGAFVEFMPGKDGLLHISEISHERLATMDGVLNVGDKIDVKLTEIDKKTGKYRLSKKALL